jgi:hypothetical protein
MRQNLFRPNIQHLGRPHACSRLYCDPLNEISLVARGYMDGPATTEHLYLCKFGQYHECGEEECGYDEVCPVSGMAHIEQMDISNYDSNKPITWGKPSSLISDAHAERMMRKYVPETPHPQPAPRIVPEARSVKLDEVFLRIESLIDRILFSDQRKKINATCTSQQARKSKREKDMYIAECAERRVPINMVQLIMIDTKYAKNIHMLNIIPRDDAMLTKYANFVLQVYIRVQHCMSEKVCPDAITLGTLYKMQQGMKVNDVTLIPLDPFLANNLPLMNDLPKFQVNKKKYTQGERLIFLMFDHGRKEGKSEEELVIGC